MCSSITVRAVTACHTHAKSAFIYVTVLEGVIRRPTTKGFPRLVVDKARTQIISAAPRRHFTQRAAIMFSDIVGYTAIMGRDERKAMRALAVHRQLLRKAATRVPQPHAI